MLIALHALRSARLDPVSFTRPTPDKPLIVVLTGTDLYRDIQTIKKLNDPLN